MALDRVFTTPKMEIDQSRYEELIRAELKCEQYRAELERLDMCEVVRIIEAKKLEVCVNEEKESEEN